MDGRNLFSEFIDVLVSNFQMIEVELSTKWNMTSVTVRAHDAFLGPNGYRSIGLGVTAILVGLGNLKKLEFFYLLSRTVQSMKECSG